MLVKTALLAMVGLLVSTYGYFIEQKIARDSNYTPACDISEKISCSKPLTSPYSNLFKISNTFIGMGFYATVLTLSILEYKNPLLYLSAASVGISIYLAYILYFKVKSFCLLCSTIYGVNIGLLLASYNYMYL